MVHCALDLGKSQDRDDSEPGMEENHDGQTISVLYYYSIKLYQHLIQTISVFT